MDGSFARFRPLLVTLSLAPYRAVPLHSINPSVHAITGSLKLFHLWPFWGTPSTVWLWQFGIDCSPVVGHLILHFLLCLSLSFILSLTVFITHNNGSQILVLGSLTLVTNRYRCKNTDTPPDWEVESVTAE